MSAMTKQNKGKENDNKQARMVFYKRNRRTMQ